MDEGLDAALVMQVRRRVFGMAIVGQEQMRTPELRKASSRSRCSSVAKSNSSHGEGLGRDGSERHFGAGQQPPVGRRRVADHDQRRHGVAMRGSACNVPCRCARCANPAIPTSALTTETPTPCRPPETL